MGSKYSGLRSIKYAPRSSRLFPHTSAAKAANQTTKSPHDSGKSAPRPSARELTHLPEHVSQHAVRLFADQRAPEHSSTCRESASLKGKPWESHQQIPYLVVVKGRPPMFRVNQSVCEPR